MSKRVGSRNHEKPILERIQFSGDLKKAENADLVVEAVFEDLNLKQDIFRRLMRYANATLTWPSNTSSMPITELGAVTRRPERVLGLHFFSPVPMMQAVEVVRGVSNVRGDHADRGLLWCGNWGKATIRVESDLPGFLLNRINLVSSVEAIKLLEQGWPRRRYRQGGPAGVRPAHGAV